MKTRAGGAGEYQMSRAECPANFSIVNRQSSIVNLLECLVDAAHVFDNLLVDVVVVEFAGHADGVEDGDACGRAVGDDGEAVHADEGTAADGIGAHALAEGLEDAAHADGTNHGHDAALDGSLHGVREEFGGAFDAFEEDVAGETIGHGDIEPVFKEVVAFGVAHEVEGQQAALVELTEQGIGLEGGLAAFAVLCAVAHDTDSGLRAVVHIARHEGGHDSVADHVAGLGIRVGAGVAHEHVAMRSGQGGDDAGAFHTGQQAQLDGAGGHGGTGVAGREHGIGHAALHQINGDAHGGFLLLAHGHDAAFLHGDHLRGMHELNLGMIGDAGGFAAGFDGIAIAHHIDFFQVRDLSQS